MQGNRGGERPGGEEEFVHEKRWGMAGRAGCDGRECGFVRGRQRGAALAAAAAAAAAAVAAAATAAAAAIATTTATAVAERVGSGR